MVVIVGTTVGLVVGLDSSTSVNVTAPDDDTDDDTTEDDKDEDKDDEKDDETGDGKDDDDKDNEGDVDDVPVVTDPLVFALPMNSPTIIKDFSATRLQYNATLDCWEAHKAVDLTSSDLNVYSVLDGKVLSVEYDFLEGYVVKVEHSDGFISEYGSLSENVLVKQGDEIKKGDQIGKASTTASNSSSYGNHTEFSLYKDNEKIDPNNYLELENK